MKRLIWTSTSTREGRGTLTRRRRSRKTSAPLAVAAQPDSLDHVERAHVQRILADSASLNVAAARLGIDLSTLWRMRKRWGLA
jgi:transcriptional regulator with PAS, ATPase and Fis domain